MRGYFSDAGWEVRKSMRMLLPVLLLFIVLEGCIYAWNIQMQKQAYIGTVGSVAAKMLTLDPGLEREVMPLLTSDITYEDREAGRKLLQEYGITERLEATVFPGIHMFPASLILCTAMSCVLALFHYKQYSALLAKVRNLTAAARKLLRADYSAEVDEEGEGDFAKLAVEFSNIRRVIQNNMEQSQREGRRLAELLQNISHQLKTKLTTMLLYNDILLNRKLSETQRIQYLKDNEKQLNNMNEMIQQVLRLARLDAQIVQYEYKTVNLDVLLEDCIGGLSQISRENDVEVSCTRTDCALKADYFWMKEALQNIIKNCIEHSPHGRVSVHVVKTPVLSKIIISDTGEGISQQELPNIFQRFYKSQFTKKNDSVGIGLSIAKAVIEAHGGYIDVESAPGKGTTFTLSFMNDEKR